MKLNALLLTSDQPCLRVITAALDELEIEPDDCPSAQEAMERLVQGHYSALVLDFDLPGAAQVAKLARMAPPERRPVVFAMIGALTAIAGTFQAGANFVLYKPLAAEQMMRSLRAGRGFMKADRRRSPRHTVNAIAFLGFGSGTMPAMILDLNEDGFALQAPEPIPAVPAIPLHFLLPGTTHHVEGTGEVLWADDSGRAGFFFAELTPASRKHLRNWLEKKSTGKRAAHTAPRPERRRAAAASH